MGERKSSFGKMSKKQQAALIREQELQRQREPAVPRQPPKLPGFAPPPELQTFGGEDRAEDADVPSQRGYGRPSTDTTTTRANRPPVPPIPENVDPYARTESMTHRGRYSYASSAISSINSPRRVRRRKDPTPFK